MSSFGGLTDHFGIASTDLIVQEPSFEVDALDRADAVDENGDIAAATWYGNTAGNLKSVSVPYKLVSGTLDLSTLACGYFADAVGPPAVLKRIIESIEVSTDNGDWPTITVTGKLGVFEPVAPTDKLNTFELPAITITGAKRAQELGFAADAACRLTSASLTASIDVAQADDGVGEPAAHGLSGGVIEVSADFVAVTGVCAWTPEGSWTETQPPTKTEGQAAYHTGTGTMQKIFERDAAGGE